VLFYTGRMTPLLRRPTGSCGLRKSLYAATLAGCLLLIPAPAAVAHDELTESEPAPNSSWEEPPQLLSLSFSGDVVSLGAQVQVNGPLGSATEGDLVVEGRHLHQELSAAAGAGDYEVIWRATSTDGHPLSGSFGYTVLATDADSSATQTDRAHDPDDTDGEDVPDSATDLESTHAVDPKPTDTEDDEPTDTSDAESTHTEDAESTQTGDSESTQPEDSESTQPEGSESTPTGDSEEASTQDSEDTVTQDSGASSTSTVPTGQADKAARTDAVVIASEPRSAGGMAPWMWALIAVALVAVAGVGTAAVRRR